jgi:hypothetical protein
MSDELRSDELRVKCPFCPKCGSEPPWIFPTMAQAFCINEECDVLCWTPWDTAAANLADMHEAEIIETPWPEPPAA